MSLTGEKDLACDTFAGLEAHIEVGKSARGDLTQFIPHRIVKPNRDGSRVNHRERFGRENRQHLVQCSRNPQRLRKLVDGFEVCQALICSGIKCLLFRLLIGLIERHCRLLGIDR